MQLLEGTLLQIDSSTPIRAGFLTCVQLGCIAEYDAPDEVVSQLKQSGKLSIQATNGDGQSTKFVFSLDGFTGVYSKSEGNSPGD